MMVNPILIGAIILTMVIGGIYGGKEVFRLKGSNETQVEVIPSDEENRFPQNFTEDLKEIANEFPAEEVVQSASKGLGGIAKFFSTIITKIISWIYGFFRPGSSIPKYMGLLIFFFVVVLIAWKTLGTFFDWTHEGLKYLLIIGGLGLGVFFILLFLNLL